MKKKSLIILLFFFSIAILKFGYDYYLEKRAWWVLLDGYEHYYKKKYSDALAYCSKAIEVYPQFSEAFLLKGIIHNKLNQSAEALKCIDKSIKSNPDNYYAYNERGNTWLDLKTM